MINYALIGASGYIAPRHMRAIHETNGVLIAALDPSDSVGIIDKYFPEAHFFTEFERFDRHIDKLKRIYGSPLDYISICSPNYLHDSHIRFSLRHGANAICEKPLVLNPWNIDALAILENETGKKVNTILQLRVHPSIINLKKHLDEAVFITKHKVDLTYITSRGRWYFQSWKGSLEKSGGIATNIGVHFFDVLYFLFGKLQHMEIHLKLEDKIAGYFEYEKAVVRWYLSLDLNDVPRATREKGGTTFRSISVDGNEVEFSDGFVDLHTLSYKKITEGNGFSLEDSRCAIETVASLRTSPVSKSFTETHPFLAKRT